MTTLISNPVDLLIGSDLFWQLIKENNKDIGNNIRLQETKLGWIVSGNVLLNRTNQNSLSFLTLDEKLERFWQLEEAPIKNKFFTDEEEACEINFKETTARDDSGKFIVKLPLKQNVSVLGDSRQVATKRFYSVEKRLENDNKLKKMYVDFMKDYIELGHMTEINEYSNEIEYYLPHHHVLRECSTTTKLRVVFDGSAKTTSNVSLNDIQNVGPVMQSDLYTILIRFRQHKYIAVADIEKMYRQVLINPEQRCLQKIV